MEEYLTMNTLLEDLSDIAKEYLYDIILEDIDGSKDSERDEKRNNIFKRFFNKFIEIMKFIGRKIKDFYKKFCAYAATLKDAKCVVKEDCKVPSEIISGVQAATFNSIYGIAVAVGHIKEKDPNSTIEDYLHFFEIKEVEIKKGTILQLNILKRNLLNVESYHDKVTKKLENLADKLNAEKDIPRVYFSTVQDILKRYQTYLIKIMNAMGDFIKTKVSKIDNKEIE